MEYNIIKERPKGRDQGGRKMKYRAWFINCLGHYFHREFNNGNEMEDFINRAGEIGTKLITFESVFEEVQK